MIYVRLLLATLATLVSSTLMAQSSNPWDKVSTNGAWSFSGGLASIVSSAYQGDGGSKVRVVPYFSARYGPVVFSPVEGLGIRLRSGGGWSYGAFLAPGFDKRKESDSIQPELRLNGSYDLDLWRVGVTVKQRLGNSDNRGLSMDADLRYTFIETSNIRLGGSAVISWMDAAYGRNIFGTGSGFKSVGINVNAFYTLSPQWSLFTLTGFSKLQGEASRSLLVNRTNKVTAVLGAVYQF